MFDVFTLIHFILSLRLSPKRHLIVWSLFLDKNFEKWTTRPVLTNKFSGSYALFIYSFFQLFAQYNKSLIKFHIRWYWLSRLEDTIGSLNDLKIPVCFRNEKWNNYSSYWLNDNMKRKQRQSYENLPLNRRSLARIHKQSITRNRIQFWAATYMI